MNEDVRLLKTKLFSSIDILETLLDMAENNLGAEIRTNHRPKHDWIIGLDHATYQMLKNICKVAKEDLKVKEDEGSNDG